MTTADLKTEIESGPLAAVLAPFLTDVFPAEPEPPAAPKPTDGPDTGGPAWEAYQTRARWERIRHRFGLLTPEACDGILRVLSAPSFTRLSPEVTRGQFMATLAKLSVRLSGKATDVVDRWKLILTLAAGGDDRINLARPDVADMFALAVADGLLSTEEKDAILSGVPVSCSRLDLLGWSVTGDVIQVAVGRAG